MESGSWSTDHVRAVWLAFQRRLRADARWQVGAGCVVLGTLAISLGVPFWVALLVGGVLLRLTSWLRAIGVITP